MVRSARSLAFVSLLLACASACGRREPAALAREVATQLAALGVPPRTVRCDGAQCRAELADGQWAPLPLETRADGVHWRLGAVVVATAPLERYLAAELAALGLGAAPRCGARYLVLSAPRRVRCELGPHGVAWVDLQADGSYALEVALGVAVAERERGPSVSELEQRSRQLAGGDAAADEGDGDGEPSELDDGAAPASQQGHVSR